MKSIFLKSVLFLTLSLFLNSCSSDDDNSSGGNQIPTIISNVEDGTWRITKFIDSGDNETNHFNGYNFTFNSSGVLSAANGANTYNGTWSVTDSSSSSSSSDDLDFNISFVSPPDFEELSDDWDFISQSSTKIELIDVSGGNGGTDYLTFEKN